LLLREKRVGPTAVPYPPELTQSISCKATGHPRSSREKQSIVPRADKLAVHLGGGVTTRVEAVPGRVPLLSW
jgi:hypothetical protein